MVDFHYQLTSNWWVHWWTSGCHPPTPIGIGISRRGKTRGGKRFFDSGKLGRYMTSPAKHRFREAAPRLGFVVMKFSGWKVYPQRWTTGSTWSHDALLNPISVGFSGNLQKYLILMWSHVKPSGVNHVIFGDVIGTLNNNHFFMDGTGDFQPFPK